MNCRRRSRARASGSTGDGSGQTAESGTTRAVGVSAAMLQQKAVDLVSSTRGERALILRAKPRVAGGDLKVGAQVVRVAPGISSWGSWIS